MKRTLNIGAKLLAVLLTLVMVIGILPMRVFAEEVNEYFIAQSDQDASNTITEEEEATDTEPAIDSVIAGEVVSKRGETTKQFKNTDGSFLAVDYGYPVHYKDGSEWLDVDYSIVSSGKKSLDGPVELSVKAAPYGVSLSDKIEDSKTVCITIDGHEIMWGPKDASERAKIEIADNAGKIEELTGNDRFLILPNVSSRCTYYDVYNDVDIEYVLSPCGVKENVILKSPKTQSEFVFEYTIDSLKAKQTDDKTITLYDEDDKAVTTICAPYMIDAAGQISGAVSLKIEEFENGTLTARLTADEKWLKFEERQYPVTIDPVLTTKVNYEQTFVASGTPTTNYYDYGDMFVGYDSANYKICRGYTMFTFPTLPNGSVITDAIFRIYQRSYSCSPSLSTKTTYTLHNVPSTSWAADAITWNNKPAYEPLIIDYVTLSDANSGYNHDFNITKLVKQIYETSNTTKKLALMLKGVNETMTQPYANVRLCTTRNPDIPTWAYPYVFFRYIDTKGVESCFSYTTASAGSAGTAHVNNYTGNLVLTHGDESTFRIKVPATVSHVYNSVNSGSQVDTKPYVGKGWRLNVQQTIKTTGLADYPYKYTDADGTEIYFYKKDNKYYDELGGKLELIVGTGNPTYTIKDDQDGVLLFSASGCLYEIRDSNGNFMKIYREVSDNNRITYVKDSSNNTITLTTNGSGYLTSLKNDQSNRVTSFAYGSNRLTTITYPDGKTSTYGYSGDLLTSANGYDGYSLNFTYSGTGNRFGIAEIQEKGGTTNGQKITFDRSKHNTTKIRSAGSDDVYGNTDDAVTVYQFDNAGRAVCVQSQNAGGGNNGAVLYKYTSAAVNSTGSNIKQLNRVTDETSFGRNIVNFAVNPGAERAIEANTWILYNPGGITQSFVRSSAQKYYGNYSFALTCSASTGGNATAYQNYNISTLVPGETYTVSAYVKTVGITKATDTSEQFGAAISLNTYGAGSSSSLSELVTGTTSTEIDNGWRRVSVTLKIPANASHSHLNLYIRNATGTAYFDGIQVERYYTAESFNLLENSSFERGTGISPDRWNHVGLNSGDGVSTAQKKEGSNGFKIVGDMATEKYIYQEVPVSGTEADTYIVSGWAKGSAAKEFDGNNRKFKISVKVTFSDGTFVWKSPAEFNHTITDWQYSSSTFNLSDNNAAVNRTPVSIGIYLQYSKEPNTGYYDFVQLIKDPAPSYTYNSNGELVSVAENAAQKSSMVYSNSNLTQFTAANGYNYTYGYDSKHNMTSAASQNGVVSGYTYNTYGEPTDLTVKNPANTLNIKTTVAYANNGQYLSSLTDEDGRAISYAYNTATGTLSSVTNQKSVMTSYTYNANNDLLTNVSSGGASVSYAYNAKNQLGSITHNGFNYNFAYDVFGNTTSVSVGSQPLATYSYRSANGKLQSVTYGNGFVKSYGYIGTLGLLGTISYNGAQKFSWAYKSDGTVLSHKDSVNNREQGYVYDSTGRLIRQNTTVINNKSNSLHTMEYGYDMMNNVSRLVNAANGVTITPTYTYGKDNLITRHDMNTLRKHTYTYDTLNRLTNMTMNSTTPISLDYTYTLSERNTAGGTLYTTSKLRTEVIGDTAYLYTYDNTGNILTISETTRANKDNESAYVLKQSYEYDSLDRLTRENDVNTGNTILYEYDAGGNFTSWKYYPYTTDPTASLGEPEETYGFAYDTAWKDKLLEMTVAYDGQGYSMPFAEYDEIGNPTTLLGVPLTWTGRELTSFNDITYTYDANGLRTSKTLENGKKIEYYYSGSRLMFEHREITYNEQPDGMSLYYTYDDAGNLSNIRYIIDSIGYQHNYYPVCNSRGDVETIYDYHGNVSAKYTYDAWGLILSITDADGNEIYDEMHIGKLNPFRYRGYYYDTETGIYYLQSRYYVPFLRRFFNADGYVQTGQGLDSQNMYTYCGNNPVNRYDLLGDSWWSALKNKISDVWNSVKTTVSKSWSKAADSNQNMSCAYGGVATSKDTTIKNGWTYRIDKANPKTNTKRHIHIEKNGKKYSQNEDGSPHDGSTGAPPNRILKELKEKNIWDWEGNFVGNPDYAVSLDKCFYGMPGFYYVPIADTGIAIIPALPSVSFSFPSLCPAW